MIRVYIINLNKIVNYHNQYLINAKLKVLMQLPAQILKDVYLKIKNAQLGIPIIIYFVIKQKRQINPFVN